MEYQTEKIRYISHEVKNQLSICDLYTEILQRYCQKNDINDETICKSVDCIKRALKMANHSLLELKSADNQELNEFFIKPVLEEAVELAKVYSSNKASIKTEINIDEKVIIDKNRFIGVVINIIKNACEAFTETNDNNYIKISAGRKDSIICIKISNNAPPIENIDAFSEGVTTKSEGSGLGLYIARQNMEEMSGAINLVKSDRSSTEFEILLKRIS